MAGRGGPGARVEGAAHTPAYWCLNARQTVLFSQAVAAMADIDAFVEIGSHPVLGASIRETLRARRERLTVVPTLVRQQAERVTMARAVAALHAIGSPVAWEKYQPCGEHVDLPRYPWQRQRHWAESAALAKWRLGTCEHPLLGERTDDPGPTWESTLTETQLPWLSDHKIDGAIVLPGAGFIEAAIAAQKALQGDGGAPCLSDVQIRKALFVEAERVRTLRMTIDPDGAGFSFHSRASLDDEWLLHVPGRLVQLRPEHAARADIEAIRRRFGAPMEKEQVYRYLYDRGFHYGPSFRLIARFWHSPAESLTEIGLPDSVLDQCRCFTMHPAILDACIHALVAGQSEAARGAYLPGVCAAPAGRSFGARGSNQGDARHLLAGAGGSARPDAAAESVVRKHGGRPARARPGLRL